MQSAAANFHDILTEIDCAKLLLIMNIVYYNVIILINNYICGIYRHAIRKSKSTN